MSDASADAQVNDATAREALAEAALRAAEEQGEGHSEVHALLTLAEICGEDRLSKRPVRLIRRAYKKARRLGLGLAVAECEKAMVNFYGSRGDETRAGMYLRRDHITRARSIRSTDGVVRTQQA